MFDQTITSKESEQIRVACPVSGKEIILIQRDYRIIVCPYYKDVLSPPPSGWKNGRTLHACQCPNAKSKKYLSKIEDGLILCAFIP